jgi:hypothetical protein
MTERTLAGQDEIEESLAVDADGLARQIGESLARLPRGLVECRLVVEFGRGLEESVIKGPELLWRQARDGDAGLVNLRVPPSERSRVREFGRRTRVEEACQGWGV